MHFNIGTQPPKLTKESKTIHIIK